jgi:hypothetical protein
MCHYLHVLFEYQLDWYHLLYKTNINWHVCLEIVDVYSQFKLENKWQHETIFLDLYYIKKHVGAKKGLLLEAKNNVLKEFSQKKSHWFITNLFSNMVEDNFFPFLWTLPPFLSFCAYGCVGQIYNDHKKFKRICEFYHGACNVSVSSLKVLGNTSLTINKIGLYV